MCMYVFVKSSSVLNCLVLNVGLFVSCNFNMIYKSVRGGGGSGRACGCMCLCVCVCV